MMPPSDGGHQLHSAGRLTPRDCKADVRTGTNRQQRKETGSKDHEQRKETGSKQRKETGWKAPVLANHFDWGWT